MVGCMYLRTPMTDFMQHLKRVNLDPSTRDQLHVNPISTAYSPCKNPKELQSSLGQNLSPLRSSSSKHDGPEYISTLARPNSFISFPTTSNQVCSGLSLGGSCTISTSIHMHFLTQWSTLCAISQSIPFGEWACLSTTENIHFMTSTMPIKFSFLCSLKNVDQHFFINGTR